MTVVGIITSKFKLVFSVLGFARALILVSWWGRTRGWSLGEEGVGRIQEAEEESLPPPLSPHCKLKTGLN